MWSGTEAHERAADARERAAGEDVARQLVETSSARAAEAEQQAAALSDVQAASEAKLTQLRAENDALKVEWPRADALLRPDDFPVRLR